MQKKISANRSLIPAKPEVKTQAAGFKYQSFADDKVERLDESTASDTELYNKLAGNDPLRYTKIISGRYDGTPMPKDYPKSVEVKKAPKMSATRSWQIIKDSMSKDELEEHYKEHPKERPVKLMPVKLDPMLEEIYHGTVVNPKFEAVKRQYLKDEEARRMEKKRTARAGIKTILNFYK